MIQEFLRKPSRVAKDASQNVREMQLGKDFSGEKAVAGSEIG